MSITSEGELAQLQAIAIKRGVPILLTAA